MSAVRSVVRAVHRDDDLDPRWFWPAFVIGGSVSLYGMVRVAQSFVDTPAFVRWLVGLAIVHDLVVAPVVAIVGWVVHRVLPRWAAHAVVPALAVAAITALFAWPLVRGYGVRPSPSHLPRDYVAGLTVILVLIAAVTLGACIRAAVRRRRGSPARSDPRTPAPGTRPR